MLPSITKSCRRIFTLVAFVAIITIASILAPQARAALVHVDYFEDGSELYVYYSSEFDEFYWVYYDAEGNFADAGTINPGPDGTEAPGDWNSRMRLALQQGGGGIAGPSWEQTPLGQNLTGHGGGLGPVYNPADVGGDDQGGQSPSSINFQSDWERFEEMWAGAGYPHGPGFDGNGGSMAGQVRDALKSGKKQGGGDDDDDAKPSDAGLFDDSMPGPPELVNPAWVGAFGTTQTRSFGTPTLNRSFGR